MKLDAALFVPFFRHVLVVIVIDVVLLLLLLLVTAAVVAISSLPRLLLYIAAFYYPTLSRKYLILDLCLTKYMMTKKSKILYI